MPKGVLELGLALVKEMGLDPGDDTLLSSWMAHYIAELIEGVETASAEDRPEKMAKCADAILVLWEHRHQLPTDNRPFEDFAPVLRALKSLDPTDKTPRYFRSLRKAIDKNDESSETRKWLELADGLDYSAKLLIGHCLMQASQTAVDKSKGWVSLAEAAGLEEGLDFTLIRIITDESKLLQSEPGEKGRKELKDRIERLESFAELAASLSCDLQRKLKQSS